MEILNEDGSILITERDVLERWRTDFDRAKNLMTAIQVMILITTISILQNQ